MGVVVTGRDDDALTEVERVVDPAEPTGDDHRQPLSRIPRRLNEEAAVPVLQPPIEGRDQPVGPLDLDATQSEDPGPWRYAQCDVGLLNIRPGDKSQIGCRVWADSEMAPVDPEKVRLILDAE